MIDQIGDGESIFSDRIPGQVASPKTLKLKTSDRDRIRVIGPMQGPTPTTYWQQN